MPSPASVWGRWSIRWRPGRTPPARSRPGRRRRRFTGNGAVSVASSRRRAARSKSRTAPSSPAAASRAAAGCAARCAMFPIGGRGLGRTSARPVARSHSVTALPSEPASRPGPVKAIATARRPPGTVSRRPDRPDGTSHVWTPPAAAMARVRPSGAKARSAGAPSGRQASGRWVRSVRSRTATRPSGRAAATRRPSGLIARLDGARARLSAAGTPGAGKNTERAEPVDTVQTASSRPLSPASSRPSSLNTSLVGEPRTGSSRGRAGAPVLAARSSTVPSGATRATDLRSGLSTAGPGPAAAPADGGG